jgi:hypothetical protein
LKEDSRGSRLSKASKDSTRRIDAAVSVLMAFDRAANAAAKPVKKRKGTAFGF